jgi:hypothetical protein
MTKLTEVLMWWEKVPDTPAARKFMKGWVYEVAEEADYNAGSLDHDEPFYFLEIRIPINRLDLLAKQGPIRDFTQVVLEPEGSWQNTVYFRDRLRSECRPRTVPQCPAVRETTGYVQDRRDAFPEAQNTSP